MMIASPQKNQPNSRLGLGKKSWAILADIGIYALDNLQTIGAVNAYRLAKKKHPHVSLNLLWALEGVIVGKSWREVSKTERTRLLLLLDDLESEGRND